MHVVSVVYTKTRFSTHDTMLMGRKTDFLPMTKLSLVQSGTFILMTLYPCGCLH